MRTVHHEASVNPVNYTYYAPKANSEGKIKGVMYEKIDKNTGETKLKSGSNALEKLLMKVRGYAALKESSAKDFLKAEFPKANNIQDLVLTPLKHKSAGKSNDFVSASLLYDAVRDQQDTATAQAASNINL
jgi:hypothetical protein